MLWHHWRTWMYREQSVDGCVLLCCSCPQRRTSERSTTAVITVWYFFGRKILRTSCLLFSSQPSKPHWLHSVRNSLARKVCGQGCNPPKDIYNWPVQKRSKTTGTEAKRSARSMNSQLINVDNETIKVHSLNIVCYTCIAHTGSYKTVCGFKSVLWVKAV